ncbi:MAG: hypothetical protein K2X86_00200, partial [Cytophagaceae bacterium]|nr:hypothetical protein [Cytophagaceae bacterium]
MKKVLILSLIIFCISGQLLASYTYTVNSNADAGAGTLRQALQDAASNVAGTNGVGTPGAPHTIVFALAPGTTILLNSDLQINNNPNHFGLTVNAVMAGVPGIILQRNGAAAGDGFRVDWDIQNVTIKGFVFQNFENGIRFRGACTGSRVQTCYFGTNLGATAIQNPLLKDGVFLELQCTNITIGGYNASERNIFAGCMFITNPVANNVRLGAIQLGTKDYSGNACNNNYIIGNYIGTDITGLIGLGNGNNTAGNLQPLNHHGVNICSNSHNNEIINNVIAASQGLGICVENTSNGVVIQGNKIGTDKNGMNPLPNKAGGIRIEAGNSHIIGYDGVGSATSEKNIISANGGATHGFSTTDPTVYNEFNQGAIYLTDVSNTSIKGNYIGTDSTGNSTTGQLTGVLNDMGNRYVGIKLNAIGGTCQTVTIGGTTAGERNIICGNGFASTLSPGNGIEIQYTNCRNNTILGNYIGVGANGTAKLGNRYNGISILGARDNTIGGNTAAHRNVIVNNVWGIMFQVDFGFPSNTVATGNIVIGNYIGVAPDGVTQMGNGRGAGDVEGAGVGIQHGCNNNYIGRDNAGEGNLISGNRAGILLRTEDDGTKLGPPTNNKIYNNIIGLDATGAALPNTGTGDYGHGISIIRGGFAGNGLPFGNLIGGTGANQRNIISSNSIYGIKINGVPTKVTAANTISGNYIGLGTNGLTDRGNTSSGIYIEAVNGTIISSNTISGNDEFGIQINNSNTTQVRSNRIGLGATAGSGIVQNNFHGIFIYNGSQSNTIGGAGFGNYISGNGQTGIFLTDAATTSNVISANFIGLDTAGNTDYGNTLQGIHVNGVTGTAATATLIGGATANERNIISGNNVMGIMVENSPNTKIYNNYIGTNTAGTSAIANSINGIWVFNSSSVIIGGAGQGNVVSANGQMGIKLENAPTTTVHSNYIGVNAAGTAGLGNVWHGLEIIGTSNGTQIISNVISGNGVPGTLILGNGISINSNNNHTIQGNYLGTNAAGTAIIRNHLAGLSSSNSTGNTIGGVALAQRNIISGNDDVGVYMFNCDNNTFTNNFIGADVTGNGGLGNKNQGVYITD